MGRLDVLRDATGTFTSGGTGFQISELHIAITGFRLARA